MNQRGSPRPPFGETGIAQWIVILILAIALPATLLLVRQTQIFKPKAEIACQDGCSATRDRCRSTASIDLGLCNSDCDTGLGYCKARCDSIQTDCTDSCEGDANCIDDCENGYNYCNNSCNSTNSGCESACSRTLAQDYTDCDNGYDYCTRGCPAAPPPPPPQVNYCEQAGYHPCSVGAPTGGTCPLNGETCTAYEAYICNFNGQNYCGNTPTCDDPCYGGPPPPQGSNCPGTTSCYEEEGQCNQAAADSACGAYYNDGSHCEPYNPGTRGDGCIAPPAPPSGGCPTNTTGFTACWKDNDCSSSAANSSCTQTYGSGSICTATEGYPNSHDDGCTFATTQPPTGGRCIGEENAPVCSGTSPCSPTGCGQSCPSLQPFLCYNSVGIRYCCEQSSGNQPPPPPPPPPSGGTGRGATVSISPTNFDGKPVKVYVNNPYITEAYAIGISNDHLINKIEIWAKRDGGTDQIVAWADDFINPSPGSQGYIENNPPKAPLVTGQGIVSGCRDQVLAPGGTPLWSCWIYNVRWTPTEIGNYTVYVKVYDDQGPVCDTSSPDNKCTKDLARAGNDVKFTASVTSGRYRAAGLKTGSSNGWYTEFANCVEDPNGSFDSYYKCAATYPIFCCSTGCQSSKNEYTPAQANLLGNSDGCWLSANAAQSVAPAFNSCGPGTCNPSPATAQGIIPASFISGPTGSALTGGGYIPGYGSGSTGGSGGLLPPGMYECRSGTFVQVSSSSCNLPNYCVNIGNVGLNLPGVMPQCYIDDCASGKPTGYCIGGSGGSCPAGQNNPHRVWSGPGCIGIPGCGPNECEYGQTRTSPTPTYTCNPLTRSCSLNPTGVVGVFSDISTCNALCGLQSTPAPSAGTTPQSVRIVNVAQGACNDNSVVSGRLFSTSNSQNLLTRNSDGTFSINQSWDVTTGVGSSSGVRTVCARFYSDTNGQTPLGSAFSGDINFNPSNVNCVCQTDNSCSSQCSFDKHAGLSTYSSPIKCQPTTATYISTPTQSNKDDYCRRNLRTKGDADGNRIIGTADRGNINYGYYLRAVLGQPLPTIANPDFSGDAEVGTADLDIWKRSRQ